MKRCMLAAALLVAVHGSLASADYVVVKIDLNQLLRGEKQAQPAPQPGIQPGIQPGVGPVAPLPLVIPAPIINPQQPRGVAGKGGRGGKGGAMPGQTLPGQIGGGFGGQPGVIPGQPGVIGGQPGMIGGQKGKNQKGIPQPGIQVMPVQPGIPLQPGIPIQPGVPVAPAPAPVDTGIQEPPIYVHAYLEVKSKPKELAVADKAVTFKIGEIECMVGDKKVKLWLRDKDVTYVTARSVSRLFVDKLDAELKESNDANKKHRLLALAEWALQRGLLAEFNKCIDEAKAVDSKDAVVLAVLKTRAELKKTPSVDDPGAKSLMDELRKEDYRPLVSDRGHYTLLTNIKASPAQDEELKKKLAKLEDVHAAFFYWLALKGQPRTPPAQRLVVVLIDTPASNSKDFDSKWEAFDHQPMVGSGFTARRDNVVIMASRRTDTVFEMLDSINQQLWTKFQTNQNELVNRIDSFAKRFVQNPDSAKVSPALVIPILQSLAVCQQAMDDENEMVTLSHEGIRQLITATGVLPRNVQTSEWARFGLASFFEVPPQSFYPSTGGPHWTHLVEFKALRQAKQLDPKNAGDILLKVVGDDYFRQAYDTSRLTAGTPEEQAKLKVKAENELDAARAGSWSLMYYLMRNKPKELARYFDEINTLPRDADYDNKVLRDCFARAFRLLTEESTTNARPTVNRGKLDSLATAWFSSMDSTWLDVPTYEQTAVAQRVKELALQSGPGQPATMDLPAGFGGGNAQPAPGAVQPLPGVLPPGTGIPQPGIQPGPAGGLPQVQPGKKGRSQ